MKKGWEIRPLAEVCRLTNGRAYKQSELLDEGKYRVLRVGNFFTNNHWYYSDLDLPEEKYCDAGDLLYAWSASFGPRIWAGEKVVYHYHIWKVVPDTKLVDRDFLFYFFEWDKDQIKSDQGAGTTMIHVSKGSMEARPFPIPPLTEQKRIVEVLDKAFEGLAVAKANAEANLQNARAIFEAALFSEFNSVASISESYTLSEAATEFGRGKSRHRPRNDPRLYGGKFPFIQTGDIRNARGIISNFSQSYNETGLAQSKLWPSGTVCITIAANIAETAVLAFDACFPDSVIGMVVNSEITSPEYVELMLRYYAADLKKLGKGSAQDNINLATFENAKFPFPSKLEQELVVGRLSEIEQASELAANNYLQNAESIDHLKQSLLQKAFAGELT